MSPHFNALAIYLSIAATLLVANPSAAQQTRTNALRQAQIRGQNVDSYPQSPQIRQPVERFAQGSGSRQGSGLRESITPVTPQGGAPIVGGPVGSGGAPIVGAPSGRFAPQASAPIVDHSGFVDNGAPIIYDDYHGSEIIEEAYPAELGFGQTFFDNPGDYRIGGCGPGAWQNCWIGYLSGLLYTNAELFAGAQGFRSQNFIAGTQPVDDSSFGFFGGLNLGFSLCRAACGLFSGQIGIRTSQSEFEGDFFSTDNRDQLFVTAGIFRRVDYGLQWGIVGDFFHEEWFVETDLTQIRGDIGWVYPGGNTLGFRFAAGTDDDLTSGIINGVAFSGLFAEVIDNYRFYYRMQSVTGGHADAFVGWSDADQAVFGIDFDMPVTELWGMQSGFTYFLPEDTAPTLPTLTQDAWNVYVGFSFRPQGRQWYRNYDRPLFNVADNGTFVFGRQ